MVRYLVVTMSLALGIALGTGCTADTFTGPQPDSGDPLCCDGGPDADAGPTQPDADAGIPGFDAGADADAAPTCTVCPDSGTDGSTADATDSSTVDGASGDGSMMDSSDDAGDAADAEVCTAGQKKCSGTTVDQCGAIDGGTSWQYLDSTTTDPDNCGVCGHSCQGGTCSLGVCQQVTLASSQVSPTPITVDTTTVYWGTSDSIKSVATGGGTVSVIASGLSYPPRALFVDSTNIYWISYVDTKILSCSKTAVSCSPTTVYSVGRTMNSLAGDATNLYWTMDSTTVGQPIVQQCAKTSCSPTTLAELQSNATTGSALGVAVDGSNVYWVDYYYHLGDYYEIDYCTIGGCSLSPTTLYTLGSGASLIAVDGSNVYWGGGNTINQCSKSICTTPKTLATGQSTTTTGVTQVTVDSTYVYWSNYDLNGTGDIRACAIGTSCGGTPKVFGSGPQAKSNGLALDSTSVYWTNCAQNGTSGSVQKVAK